MNRGSYAGIYLSREVMDRGVGSLWKVERVFQRAGSVGWYFHKLALCVESVAEWYSSHRDLQQYVQLCPCFSHVCYDHLERMNGE